MAIPPRPRPPISEWRVSANGPSRPALQERGLFRPRSSLPETAGALSCGPRRVTPPTRPGIDRRGPGRSPDLPSPPTRGDRNRRNLFRRPPSRVAPSGGRKPVGRDEPHRRTDWRPPYTPKARGGVRDRSVPARGKPRSGPPTRRPPFPTKEVRGRTRRKRKVGRNTPAKVGRTPRGRPGLRRAPRLVCFSPQRSPYIYFTPGGGVVLAFSRLQTMETTFHPIDEASGFVAGKG